MVNTSDFAKRLQKILDYYSVSATAFSEELDVNRSTISHLLSGRNKPSLEFVMKVLQRYPEVDLYWFLNGKGNFPTNKKETPTLIQKDKSTTSSHPPADFSKIKANLSDNSIEQIVIFYKNGSFKVYEN